MIRRCKFKCIDLVWINLSNDLLLNRENEWIFEFIGLNQMFETFSFWNMTNRLIIISRKFNFYSLQYHFHFKLLLFIFFLPNMNINTRTSVIWFCLNYSLFKILCQIIFNTMIRWLKFKKASLLHKKKCNSFLSKLFKDLYILTEFCEHMNSI